MGKVNVDIVAELLRDNPDEDRVRLQVFADALQMYEEASSNIREHGAIVAHPRTGAPIENPYLRVQKSSGETLRRMTIDGARVMKLLQKRR